MPNSKHYLLGFWAAMVSPVILLQASWGPETEGEYCCVELYTKTKTITFGRVLKLFSGEWIQVASCDLMQLVSLP